MAVLRGNLGITKTSYWKKVEMIEITLLFFATLRDMTHETRILKKVPAGMSIGELKDQMVLDYPNLAGIMNSVIVSMNHEFAFNNALVIENAEIALFPPVSGG